MRKVYLKMLAFLEWSLFFPFSILMTFVHKILNLNYNSNFLVLEQGFL